MLAEKKLEKESWHQILQEVAYSLNTMPNAGTEITPFKIMYGENPKRFPFLDSNIQDPTRVVETSRWCDEFTHSVTDTNNLGRYRDLVSGSVNKNRKHTPDGENDQVYIRNDARSDSLDPRFTGPYPITKVRGPNVVVDMGQSRQGVVHLDRCKVSTPSSCQPPPLERESGESVPEPHLPFDENYDLILENPDLTPSRRDSFINDPLLQKNSTPHRYHQPKRSTRLPIRDRDDNSP